MDIAQLQRGLLKLIKTREDPGEEDEYLQRVKSSPHLAVLQKIILLWRMYDIEHYCLLTSAVLKRKGCFDEAMQQFMQTIPASPFIERLGTCFLEGMAQHPMSLIASVARFELALLKVKQGDQGTYTIEWEYDPYLVLGDLFSPASFVQAYVPGTYQTIVSREMPGLFQVVSVKAEEGSEAGEERLPNETALLSRDKRTRPIDGDRM